MKIVDNGPEANVFDIETATRENTNYRTTCLLYTSDAADDIALV